MIVVSEPGFYELVLGSRKPGAVAFKRWVCSEILPSIRRYGQYQALADDNGNPVDVPEVMVEMVNLNDALPAFNVIHEDNIDNRIHVWEFVEDRGLDFNRNQRMYLGRIARRMLLTHNLPTRQTWKTARRYNWKKMQWGPSGVYPEIILEMALEDFMKGHKD